MIEKFQAYFEKIIKWLKLLNKLKSDYLLTNLIKIWLNLIQKQSRHQTPDYQKINSLKLIKYQ